MKVGIVSTPLYANYGGVLQNYALQQVLKKMGHEPITLDYMPSLSFWRYCLHVGKTLLCALVPSRRHPLKPYHHFLQRPEVFKRFVDKNIIHTSTVASYSPRQLTKYGVDALVVGSDQVWRKEYNRERLFDMYLKFAERDSLRRIAYAASFGTSEWTYSSEQTAECSRLLKLFDAVSVREITGAEMCRKYFDVDAEVVLDPTLLLDFNEYESLCSNINHSAHSYLLAYLLDFSVEKKNFVERVAEEHSLEVKYVSVSSEEKTSVEEWLAYFRNAGVVVTDSFHGTVFSIIFQKTFFSVGNRVRGYDRFMTLLQSLGIDNHLVDDISDVSRLEIPEIDYSKVVVKLESLRSASIDFLVKGLNEK